MNKILGTTAAIVAAAAVTTAFAHAKLMKSEPENGSIVTTAPSALKLHYNEPIEAALSRVKLTGSGAVGAQVGKPVLADGDDKTLVVPVAKLPAGDWRVEWSTMGHDGHPMKGEVRFTVK